MIYDIARKLKAKNQTVALQHSPNENHEILLLAIYYKIFILHLKICISLARLIQSLGTIWFLHLVYYISL